MREVSGNTLVITRKGESAPMATRRRIALYFDLAFEPDRRLFSQLAPYVRRKRANEIIKAALAAWLERQAIIAEDATAVSSPKERLSRPKDVAPSGAMGALVEGSSGVRELVERFAAEQGGPPSVAEPRQAPAASAIPTSDTPVGMKPRLGRLM